MADEDLDDFFRKKDKAKAKSKARGAALATEVVEAAPDVSKVVVRQTQVWAYG